MLDRTATAPRALNSSFDPAPGSEPVPSSVPMLVAQHQPIAAEIDAIEDTADDETFNRACDRSDALLNAIARATPTNLREVVVQISYLQRYCRDQDFGDATVLKDFDLSRFVDDLERCAASPEAIERTSTAPRALNISLAHQGEASASTMLRQAADRLQQALANYLAVQHLIDEDESYDRAFDEMGDCAHKLYGAPVRSPQDAALKLRAVVEYATTLGRPIEECIQGAGGGGLDLLQFSADLSRVTASDEPDPIFAAIDKCRAAWAEYRKAAAAEEALYAQHPELVFYNARIVVRHYSTVSTVPEDKRGQPIYASCPDDIDRWADPHWSDDERAAKHAEWEVAQVAHRKARSAAGMERVATVRWKARLAAAAALRSLTATGPTTREGVAALARYLLRTLPDHVGGKVSRPGPSWIKEATAYEAWNERRSEALDIVLSALRRLT